MSAEVYYTYSKTYVRLAAKPYFVSQCNLERCNTCTYSTSENDFVNELDIDGYLTKCSVKGNASNSLQCIFI